MYKRSEIGSFFDGIDYLDKIKEEQNRIQQRYVRDYLRRQNLGNDQTYSVETLREQMDEAQQQAEAQTEQFITPRMHDAGTMIQTQLQTARDQAQERIRQTGEAFAQNLRSTGSNMMSMFGRRRGQASAPSVAETARPQNLPMLDDDDTETLIQDPTATGSGSASPPPLPLRLKWKN